ncbi:MAG: CxxxxCH/CxxCH domain-containing protein [Deltaproteobacteria bacterium]|nr:CxxxxCH/CxxCH domain-containing protein [Deltaproteobacteria bacterium]
MLPSGRRFAVWMVLLAVAGGWMVFSSSGQAGMGVVGSPHDFSTTTPGPWTRDNAAYTSGGVAPSGVCSACHVPHFAKYAPLWPRNLSNYDNAFLLDGSGGSSGKPNYRRAFTNQCYDCHDYHQTSVERIDDLPNFSKFSNASSGHKPQNIAFGFTTPLTGKDLNSTMKEDIPAGTVSGYYENTPPFQTQPTRNYGANDNARRPLDNTTLGLTGGHFFKSGDPNATGGAYKGDKLPCSDCHEPHMWDGNGAWQAFFRRSWPSGSPVWTRLQSWSGRASTYMANAPTPTGATRSDLDSRTMCEACHGSADSGNPPVTYPQINDSSSPNPYTNNQQIVGLPSTVSEHFNSRSQAACVGCHSHNNIGASCSQCHGFPPSSTAPVPYPARFTPVPNPDNDADTSTRDAHPMHYGGRAGDTRGIPPYIYLFECGTCHYGSAMGIDSSLAHHQDNLVSVVLQGTYTKAPNGPGGAYDNTNYYNQGPGFPFPPTRTGQLDNTNVSPNGWGAGSRYGGDTCRNVYCHSAGRATASMAADNDNDFRRPVWNSGQKRCNDCHGLGTDNTTNGGINYGMPSYANGGAGTDNANSHSAHVVTNGIECSVCHAGTVTGSKASRSIVTTTVPSLHVNRVRNVQFGGGVTGTYDNNTKTCATSCHGGLPWGSAASGCAVCHSSNNPDTDLYLNGTDNLYSGVTGGNIDNTEWIWSGHGRPTSAGAYEKSGYPAANFGGHAGAGDPCYYCHNPYVSHDNSTNPFRLKDQTGAASYLATLGWNATCMVCHIRSGTPPPTPPPGYQPAVGYDNVKAASSFVDNAHYGTKHTSTNGGKFCWDCHDPHGDRSQTNGNNIYMIHGGTAARGGTAVGQLLRQSDNVYGIRGSSGQLTANAPSFTDNASGANYVDNNATKRGICQVCHTQPAIAHYRSDYYDGHNIGTRCTVCHPHNTMFAPSGGRNIEQFVDNVTGTPTANYEDRSRHPHTLTAKTYPAEVNCLGCHGVSGTTNVSNECQTCHYEYRGADNTAHPNSVFAWATPASPATPYAAYPTGSIKDTAQGDTWCLLCHGVSGGPQLAGRTPPNILSGGQSWTGGSASGHGASASLSGGASGPPAYRCGDCHYSTAVRTGSSDSRTQVQGGFHGSVNRKLVRNDNSSIQEYPHPASADTRYDTVDERSTQTNAWCATQCHRNATNGAPKDDNVVLHTWSVKGGGSRSGTQSHPTNMAPIPDSGKFRNPPALPLSEYMGGGASLPGSGNEGCVACHEPHAASNTQTDKQMLRMEWADNTSTLCKQCHI